MLLVHPKDPSLKFPLIKDILKSPEELMRELFLEYINGKQDYDSKTYTLYRPWETTFELDSISCHFTEEIRVHCPTANYPTLVQVWKSFEPQLLRSFKSIIEAREYIYNMKAKECNIFNVALCMRLYLSFNDTREPVKIIDPSAGWGDRMITAIACGDFVAQYDGYDPNKDLIGPYQRIMSTLDHKKKCRFFSQPFETAEVPKEYYDLGVTSPPFFTLETYSKKDDPNQSISGDKADYKVWLDQFYRPYLRNLHYAIRPGGKIIMYVSNFKIGSTFIDLEFKTTSILEKEIGNCKQIIKGYLKRDNKKKYPAPFLVFEKL